MYLCRKFLIFALLTLTLLAGLATVGAAQTEAEDEDPVAIFNAGQELHEKGDFAGAIKQYEMAISIVPDFPEAEYQRGSAQLSLGKTDDAERGFRKALELRPEWTLAMTSLGSLLVERAPAEAAPLLEKVVKLEPQNSLALAALTELRLNAKAAPAVLHDLLAKITALTTGKVKPTAALWAARAALESELGLKAQARTSLASALNIDTKSRTALMQAAEVALADGDLLRAKELTDRLKGVTGETDQIKYLGAAILAYEGNTDEALKLLEAIKTPNRAAIDLQTRLKAATASTADLEKMLETNPKDAAVLGRLCTITRRDDPAKAVDYCRRANAAEPENINHAIGYAAALVQARQFEVAIAVLKRLLTVAPDHATVHANLGAALFQLKRYPEAKAEFEWLIKAQPKDAAAYYFMAISHDQLGEYIDALAHYQQYLRLADADRDKLEIEKINLRLPLVEKLVKQGKGGKPRQK